MSEFAGVVGGIQPLDTLTTDAAGTTFINGGAITTNGATINFNDAVVLGADTIITELGSGDVNFNSTVDSDSPGPARDLTVNTPGGGLTIFLNGDVGSAAPLDVLTTDQRENFEKMKGDAFEINRRALFPRGPGRPREGRGGRPREGDRRDRGQSANQ